MYNPGNWWHNPHRDSRHHYSVDGLESICHKEFNSEWVIDPDPTRQCTVCLRYYAAIREMSWVS